MKAKARQLPTGKQRNVRIGDHVRLPDGLWVVLEASVLTRSADAVWVGRGARAINRYGYLCSPALAFPGGIHLRIPIELWYRFRWLDTDTLAGAWQAPAELWTEEIFVCPGWRGVGGGIDGVGEWMTGARLFRKEKS